ncbi:MAG: succinate dehydrogenase, hydrophobic membrane anchor protein [Pseudoxanthomonas suwonensis]|nr:succinate dehydrogenase, hydrophobic membrane anchor protein [Pseudoxanthomonas suwonensis]
MDVRNHDGYRTPLKNVRGLGSAKSGTGHFWWQRVSAAALALLSPWLIGLLVALSGQEPEMIRAAIARPWNAVLLTLFCLALFWHLKQGMQVVIEDYIHDRTLGLASHIALILACVTGALACVYAIARIALTAP